MKLSKYVTSFMLFDMLGIGAVFALYAIFATTPILAKQALQYGPMITFIALRFLLSGILMLWYAYSVRNVSFTIAKKDRWQFANIAFLGICVSYILLFWALQYLSVATSTFLLTLTPFFTAFFAWLHGFETFTPKKVLGMIIGALGTIPILMNTESSSHAQLSTYIPHLPEILTLISIILYAYSWIGFKQLMDRGYDESMINGVTMFTGGIACCIVAFFMDGWSMHVPVMTWSLYSVCVAITVCVCLLAFSLYAHLLKKYSPTLLSLFSFSEPFFAALFGYLLLFEKISTIFIVSLAVVAIGLFLFYQEELSLKNK